MLLQTRLTVGALAALLSLTAASGARAQGRGGGGGLPGEGAGRYGRRHRARGSRPHGRRSHGHTRVSQHPSRRWTSCGSGPGNQSTVSTVRPGLQLGPPGRWWDDKSFAKNLKLRPDQQARMDSIFEQNRGALLARYQGLQQAESQMEEVSRSPNPDESSLFSGIDRVAQARAELEKATTHYLLQIRKEMDPDQLQRLEKQR